MLLAQIQDCSAVVLFEMPDVFGGITLGYRSHLIGLRIESPPDAPAPVKIDVPGANERLAMCAVITQTAGGLGVVSTRWGQLWRCA